MISSVSKLVDKTFVLGYLLPALIAIIAARTIFGCPAPLHDACDIKSTSSFVDLTYGAVLVYALGVLLLTLNYRLYRILEGYDPPFSWFSPLQRWYVGRLQREQDRIALMDADGEDSRTETWQLLIRSPQVEDDVLPTSFGNHIRAFELYPAEIYGADSITLYSRLASVVPKDFQELINDAKSQVDFFVNVCVLSFALAVAVVIQAVAAGYRAGALPPNWTLTLGVTGASLLVSIASYFLAVSQVPNWGELVMAAFDCYLPALAKQLGYAVPSDEAGRRAFWIAFSQRVLYREAFEGAYRFASDPPTPAAAKAAAKPDDAD
jgi:hypothetical protein